MLQRMVSKIATLEGAVAAAEAKRRELHNQLVELKGNVSGWLLLPLKCPSVICHVVLR